MQDVSKGAGGQGWNAPTAPVQRLSDGEPPASPQGSPRRPEAFGEPSGGCYPSLRRIGRAYVFTRSDGNGYLIDWWWLEGAKIAFGIAYAKAWFANVVITLFGIGDKDGRRWRLLPAYGDWIFRNDYGRLSSLARFVDCELYFRDQERASDRGGTLRRREAAEGEACQPGPNEDSASPK